MKTTKEQRQEWREHVNHADGDDVDNLVSDLDEALASVEAWKARAERAEAANIMRGVLLDVIDERIAQDKQWGGPEHDDEHGRSDWLLYIQKQVTQAKQRGASRWDEGWRQHIVKIAALAVAALQSEDRARPPHPGAIADGRIKGYRAARPDEPRTEKEGP